MFVLTVGLLAAFLAPLAGWRSGPWLYFAIALICVGTLLTIVRRAIRMARRLRGAA
jgi:uncharacterized membrane protein YjjP (DUF1212 family)